MASANVSNNVHTSPEIENSAMEMDRQSREAEEEKPVISTASPFNPANHIDGGHDQQVFQMFMDPMMKELEEHVAINSQLLDKLNEQMENERKARIKARATAHIPEALKGEGQGMKTVMRTIENLMVFGEKDVEFVEEEEATVEEENNTDTGADQDDANDDGQKPEDEEDDDVEESFEEEKRRHRTLLPALDEHGRAAILAHSLASYASMLNEENLKKFTEKITSDCNLWLSRLFRFMDASAVFCEDERDGLVKICRLALYQKYPKYAAEGFEALYSRPPVIYVSAAASPNLSTYLCLQLGLPMSSISTVPCESGANPSSKMDISMLEKLIQDDIAAAKTPALLVAYAGTPLTGQVDDVDHLQDICRKNSIWLHVEGNNLATLTLVSVPTSILSCKAGDSMTVSLGKWLGIPGLPHATLYKSSDPALVHAAGLNTFNPQIKLNCLPIWICLQSLGHDGIVERVKQSCDLAEQLHTKLERLKAIRQVTKEKKEDDTPANTIRGMITRAINALLVFEIVSPTVVFRYIEEKEEGLQIAPYSSTSLTTEDNTPEESNSSIYFDALNVWLGETLQAENPGIELHVAEVENEGVCIRFSPLDSAQARGTVTEDVEALLQCLNTQIAILDATVLNRDKLKAMTSRESRLRLLDMPSWAGLGVVQYIPESWQNKGDDLPEEAVKEIHIINSELVQKLKSQDTAFSMGFTDNDVACVKFGLITEDTSIESLLELVCVTGKEVEDSSKYLETLAEVVKHGIEAANKDLEKENLEKLQNEGVFRQVPLVGSLLNWWSPPPKDSSKGRSFNLASGQISSTETLYKYHMQIQEDNSSKTPKISPQQQPTTPPVSPTQRSAGEVKASLTNEVCSAGMSPPASPGTDFPDSKIENTVEEAEEAS
ncbi:putative pyridoxal-dependent decarboxylase domain-containing protein 2 [Mizuhopecten yessoensis]|uniref:Pyridoxal-dependent decarboxylase domain-containing protein 1 n=1 Tax=Mizuhopecten yessoensis TaxID=6573 RepID=A0A210QFT9_MIZYE|nr:putative pyridoxal-dependent decarboxylase domain-containing protein 2 [Mizuhopecten yessoensis]OWF47610.1 Pyridoxal-dependent decarboxylase domain-containing protein 1 [Mizuhopecten yessoensis]